MISHSYRDLLVWQRAMELFTEVYKLTDQYPRSEQYVLTAQTRRSALSIPSNIAEGRKRSSRADYVRFITYAYSSAAELETQIQAAKLVLSKEICFTNVDQLLDEVVRMLGKLRSSLRSPRHSARAP